MNELDVIPHDDGDHVSADVYKDRAYLGMVIYYPREDDFAGSIEWRLLEVAEKEAVQEAIKAFAGTIGLLPKTKG